MRACLSCGAAVDLNAELRSAQSKLPLEERWKQAELLAGEVEEPRAIEAQALRGTVRDRALLIPISVGVLTAFLVLMLFRSRRGNSIATRLDDVGVNLAIVIVLLLLVSGAAFVFAAVRALQRDANLKGALEPRLGIVDAIEASSTRMPARPRIELRQSSDKRPWRELLDYLLRQVGKPERVVGLLIQEEHIETCVLTLRARDDSTVRLEGIVGVSDGIAPGDFVVAFTRGPDLIALRRLPVGRSAQE